MELNINLSEEQASFVCFMKENNPEFLQYWDFTGRAINLDEALSFLKDKSLDETIMMRFYMGVWFNDNRYEFDFIEAMKVLNNHDKKVIAKWSNTPFYP